jgi:hypothetical protein
MGDEFKERGSKWLCYFKVLYELSINLSVPGCSDSRESDYEAGVRTSQF